MQVALNTTLTKVSGVVSLRDFDAASCKGRVLLLRDYLCSIGVKVYALILHDRDTLEDGRLKTPHIHFVFLALKRKMKSTWINAVAKACQVNTLAVSIESYSSFEAVFQYLIHKNNPDKAQYDRSEIVTCLPEDEIDQYLAATAMRADFDFFVAVCRRSSSLLDVMQEVGIGVYIHYRKAIIDIWLLVKEKGIYPNGYGESV